jgi:hypothetical protein
MKRFNFVVVILLLAACPHSARAEVSFAYVSAGQAAQMVSGPAAPMLAQGPQFSMSLRKRLVSGHVEKHMDWNEELVIQEGDVLLNYGDSATNPRELSPGEFNADAIAGGKSVMLHAGDIVILPAGLWHQQVLKGPLMRYVLFKTRK